MSHRRAIVHGGLPLLVLILVLAACAGTNPADRGWTRQFGTSGNDYAWGVGVAADGGFLVAGGTEGSLDGAMHHGGVDAFVRRLDGNGNPTWTHQFGTAASDSAAGMFIDEAGRVAVVGMTGGALEGQPHAGGDDAFVLVLDGAGQPVWQRQFGTAAGDWAIGVAVDDAGNVAVCGRTAAGLDGQPHAGDDDAFVRSFDRDGQHQRTAQFGTAGSDVCVDVAGDGDGNWVAVGFTAGSLDGQTHAGGPDAFVRKLSAQGAVVWTHQFGTGAADRASGVAIDANGDVLVVGTTSGALDGQAQVGASDAFLRRLDAGGDVLWTRQFGSAGADEAWGVAIDAAGHAVVAGTTSGSLADGANFGGADAFVRAFDATGLTVWTRQFGSPQDDYAWGVAADASGGVLVAGSTAGALSGANRGGNDAFVRLLRP